MEDQDIKVETANFPQHGETVFYACSPSGTDAAARSEAGRTAKKIGLLSVLRKRLAGREDSPWTDRRFPGQADLPIQLVHDPLGRPRLRLGEWEGPSISFSEAGGNLWAAVCGDPSDIGIDEAGTDEFPKEYPVRRVFDQLELQQALTWTRGDQKKASALLWSIKEAAVKALGCAFHRVDPKQVRVHPAAMEKDDRLISRVSLTGKALARFPMMAGRSLWVRSFFQDPLWLSIAVLKRQPDRARISDSPDLAPDRALDSNR